MANIKLDGHTWDTSGVYDAEQAKTQKEINADVSDLKSALNEVRNFTPMTPTWVTGGFYNTNGNLASNANFSYTAKANIPESTDGIYFKSVTSADLLNVVFWDSNDRKCGFGGGTGSAFAEHSELVPIPKNAVQYGLSKYNPSSINNFYTFAFDDVKCGVNIYEYSVPDGYLNANGNVNTETTGYFSCSGYIPLNENVKSVSYILCAITNLRTVCFYNANKVFISGVTYTQETPAMIKDCVPVPVGAKYMAFSYVNETYATTLDFSQCYVYLSDVPATVQNSD